MIYQTMLYRNGLTYSIGTVKHTVENFIIDTPIEFKIQDARLLYQHVKYFVATMDAHDLDYFAIGGTLLGTVRHQGVIPWDLDVDVGVTKATYDALCVLLDQLSSINDYYQWIDTKLPGIRVFYKGSAVIDVFIVDDLPDSDSPMMASPTPPLMAYSAPYVDGKPSFDVHHSCFPKLRFPKHQLFPTRKMPFEDIMIRVPHDANAVCVINYNQACFTSVMPPPLTHTYMHKFTDSIYCAPLLENLPVFKKKVPNLYTMYLDLQRNVFGSAFQLYQGRKKLTLPSFNITCKKRVLAKESVLLGVLLVRIIVRMLSKARR